MLRRIQAISAPDEVSHEKAKKSGGSMGAAIGAVAGGVIGAQTGGSAGALAGMERGMNYGERAGNFLAPGRESSSAIQRRATAQTQQLGDGSARQNLKDSIVAVRGAPPEIQEEYTPILMNAYMEDYAKSKGLV
jgi:uncharacterized protein YcfJ